MRAIFGAQLRHHAHAFLKFQRDFRGGEPRDDAETAHCRLIDFQGSRHPAPKIAQRNCPTTLRPSPNGAKPYLLAGIFSGIWPCSKTWL